MKGCCGCWYILVYGIYSSGDPNLKPSSTFKVEVLENFLPFCDIKTSIICGLKGVFITQLSWYTTYANSMHTLPTLTAHPSQLPLRFRHHSSPDESDTSADLSDPGGPTCFSPEVLEAYEDEDKRTEAEAKRRWVGLLSWQHMID